MGKVVPSFVVDELVHHGWNEVDGLWVRDGVGLRVAQGSVNASMFSVEWSRLGSVKVRFVDSVTLSKVIRDGGF